MESRTCEGAAKVGLGAGWMGISTAVGVTDLAMVAPSFMELAVAHLAGPAVPSSIVAMATTLYLSEILVLGGLGLGVLYVGNKAGWSLLSSGIDDLTYEDEQEFPSLPSLSESTKTKSTEAKERDLSVAPAKVKPANQSTLPFFQPRNLMQTSEDLEPKQRLRHSC
jgi:hypothetical protein